MITRFARSLVVVAVFGVCAGHVPAAAPSATVAGEFDFGEFSPSAGGPFVEVDLTRDLIAIAARLVVRDEPDVSAVLSGLQRVHVQVIGIDDSNRPGLVKRVEDARAELARAGWQKTVCVRDDGQTVDVFVKTHGDEAIEGIVVAVVGENDQAVFVNVVGNIRPDQLAMIGQRFGIDPLKHIGAQPGS